MFQSGFLFFSSRIRHTRLQGDWSSDVCSSDLAMDKTEIHKELWETVYSWATNHGYTFDNPGLAKARSEERRVGKECRTRRLTGPAYNTTTGGHDGQNDARENTEQG